MLVCSMETVGQAYLVPLGPQQLERDGDPVSLDVKPKLTRSPLKVAEGEVALPDKALLQL